MQPETQAQMFIRVLAQLVEHTRKRRYERLRVQHKAHAERYAQAWRAEDEDTRRPATWTQANMQVVRDAEARLWDD